jgi:hypothetical protein
MQRWGANGGIEEVSEEEMKKPEADKEREEEDDEEDDEDEDEEEGENQTESISDFAKRRRIPISNQVDLPGHSKAVACVSIEPAGNRLVTGSLDYSMKMFDFGGMDSRHRHFKSMEPEEGHPVVSVAHSPSGDKMVVATGSAQPKIYDRLVPCPLIHSSNTFFHSIFPCIWFYLRFEATQRIRSNTANSKQYSEFDVIA